MKYKYLFFDLDGTVTDPKIGITKAVAYALHHFGIQIEDLDSLCKFIGPPLIDSFQEYYDFDKKDAQLAVVKYREYFGERGLYENKEYEGMTALLESLKKQGNVLSIATSKPTEYTVKILQHFHLMQYFDYVVGSELDGTRSKKWEVIQYALEKNIITNKSNVLMIGDREHDIIGATHVGIDSLGVLYGYGHRDEFIKAGANYIVETVSDLADFLHQ